MAVERRRYKRIYTHFPVEYRSKKLWQKVKALNISEGGMFLLTEKVESPGTHVEVIFNLGKEEKGHIYAEGRIVWNREKLQIDSQGKAVPPGVGIEFIKFFSPEFTEFIAKKVEKEHHNNFS